MISVVLCFYLWDLSYYMVYLFRSVTLEIRTEEGDCKFAEIYKYTLHKHHTIICTNNANNGKAYSVYKTVYK